MKTISLILVAFTFFMSLSVNAQEKKQQIISENITYLNQDGRSYINYITTRSGFDSYWITVDNKTDFEERYQYIYPKKYRVDTLQDQRFIRLLFDQGSYAVIVHDSFASAVTISEDGVYTFTNEGISKGQGIRNTSGNFDQFVYVWVLPDNFKFIDQKCSSEDASSWVKRGNTITYFGYNVNNLIFTIKYQRTTQENTNRLKNELANLQNVDILNNDQGFNVIRILDDIFFEPGKADISPDGIELLDTIANTLKQLEFQELIISGHTDNKPIRQSEFTSNWQLSAERALAVIKILTSMGVSEKKIKLQAFGEHRPRPDASNDTAEGRAKNRRIEILINESGL